MKSKPKLERDNSSTTKFAIYERTMHTFRNQLLRNTNVVKAYIMQSTKQPTELHFLYNTEIKDLAKYIIPIIIF